MVAHWGDDVIIGWSACVHKAEILGHEIARGRSSVPVYVQVTDFDLHPMWVTPGMAAWVMGIPVMPGAALNAVDVLALRLRAAALLADPPRLARMAAAARRIGRPYAARDVLDRVLA